MKTKAEVLAEYAESEAGRALKAKGFTAAWEDGMVLLRSQRYGVVMEVWDEGTAMAPRFMTDAVSMAVHSSGTAPAAFGLSFPSVTALIASLEMR